MEDRELGIIYVGIIVAIILGIIIPPCVLSSCKHGDTSFLTTFGTCGLIIGLEIMGYLALTHNYRNKLIGRNDDLIDTSVELPRYMPVKVAYDEDTK